MSLGDAVLTFVSVFVAALLAFYLEGLRERRATEGWVRDYLAFWRTTLDASQGDRTGNEEGLQRIDDALSRWLELGSSGVEPVWGDLDSISVNSAITFTPLLLSSGVSAVPGDLLSLMFVADATAPTLLRRAEAVSRLFEGHVLPLVLGRAAARRRALPRRVRGSTQPDERLSRPAGPDPRGAGPRRLLTPRVRHRPALTGFGVAAG
jgi:hypothetical protein